MLADNTPVAPLPRNITPSKIIRLGAALVATNSPTNQSTLVLGGRSGSNPRSSSNPRPNSNSKQARLIQKITQEDPSSNLRATSRSASRRKQRRWENSHLFGFHQELPPEILHQLLGASDLEDSLKQKQTADDVHSGRKHFTRYLFPVDDKRSAFADLFLNRELLTLFRKCEEELSSSSSSSSHTSAKSLEEKSWLNIEKKIRSILLSLVPKAETESSRQHLKSFQFLLKMEKLLFAFIENLLPRGEKITLPLFSSTTASSSSSSSSSQPRSFSYSIDPEKGHLRIDSLDSPFHRLLFHGLCQFYGLKSQSFLVKNGGANNTNKYMIINQPRKQLITFQEQISLTKYLYGKMLLTEEGEEMTVAASSSAMPSSSSPPSSSQPLRPVDEEKEVIPLQSPVPFVPFPDQSGLGGGVLPIDLSSLSLAELAPPPRSTSVEPTPPSESSTPSLSTVSLNTTHNHTPVPAHVITHTSQPQILLSQSISLLDFDGEEVKVSSDSEGSSGEGRGQTSQLRHRESDEEYIVIDMEEEEECTETP